MAAEEQVADVLEEMEYEDEMGEGSPYSPSGMYEEENMEEGTMFSHLGESSDDPEQKRRYVEYLELIKQIDCQNHIIDDIKSSIKKLCELPCKTRADMNDIACLRQCLEQENDKLNCMIIKAMNLQNFGSHRRWGEIPLATTFREESLTLNADCGPKASLARKIESSESQETESQSQSFSQGSREEQLLHMYKAVENMKICNPKDKRLIQEIVVSMMCKQKKKEQEPCPGRKPKREPCPPPPCMKTSHKSKRERREDSPCRHRREESPCPGRREESPCPDPTEKLKKKIDKMQCAVKKLNKEICKREKEMQRGQELPPCEGSCDIQIEPQEEDSDAFIVCGTKQKTKAEEMAKLKETYTHLLCQFRKKDTQLKELQMRMKALCGGPCGGGKKVDGPDPEAELELLRSRIKDLKDEQVEFKCIMVEQSHQLEDYRDKYLAAQQRVEEQCVALDKLNMNNKRIENQINCEVKEIRAKFQEKLNELLHLPKLLENEQLKLAQCCKEKEELQGKLTLICRELKAVKAQMEALKENPDCRPLLAQCQLELSKNKEQLEQCIRQRELLCEQVKITQDDLDTLRSESAKIIARTKERAEMIRQQHLQQIDCLEKELAQCRATACLSVKDREAVIREMQGQLNTLSYSFDSAQKQIKSLRNHIAYITNENNCPPKC